METRSVVGRFAPTPSGRLHLGNIFSAMLACLSARAAGGRFLLRIEDLDKARCREDDVKQLIDDLTWFGFAFDGEILRQSERSGVYARALARIAAAAEVYPCWCSRGQLHAASAPHAADGQPLYDGRCRRLPPENRPDKPPALRVAVPDRTISLSDRLQGGYAQNLAKECGDFILKRSDGVYAYQLAVVVDDALSGVTEVVRGRDLLSSAPRQIFLYRCLGVPPPSYLHTPLLLDESGERLSKRGGSSNLAELRRRFSSPEPILGALAHAAGLLPRPEPAALADLIAVYDEKKLVRGDIRLPAAFP